ncbi:hypothetical protein CWI42_030980 [Ordospora colligata]|uniref:FAR-17a/AIG1-like protein n=1 Tax=Ordospora colligata OC4 TaxID=1354746 RepID=A0A0B2ULY1_9MICR|nr:uncharacterized protein M896_030690 [Ordospora colligata OC4]KHN70082.1 hypothetical protein M896_030690 [Ordospora colligata OC4]TBU16464.1 hypothetical protein CWI41_030650 [Ordospora colligata]TBU16649.1 hypothetical protein CWI40_031050 [Ordospora colligata]TBU19222.1 hypothetical protein CWI42_030980 [Ordospora colligata]
MNEARPTRILKELTRILLLAACAYGTLDRALPEGFRNIAYAAPGARFIYLTNLSLYLTIASVVLGYTIRALKATSARLCILYKDLIAVSFSIEGVVTSMFWTLYAINPMLLRSKVLLSKELSISLTTDICQHFLPFVLMFVEQSDTVLVKRKGCAYAILALGTLYLTGIWMYSSVYGVWAYPILRKSGAAIRIMLIYMGCILGVMFYMCLVRINRFCIKQVY